MTRLQMACDCNTVFDAVLTVSTGRLPRMQTRSTGTVWRRLTENCSHAAAVGGKAAASAWPKAAAAAGPAT